MTFEELIPYHGKTVEVTSTRGVTYKGIAVADIEELDMMFYLDDGVLGLKPEEIKSIELVDEA
ncbi:MAG: hypothetical protein Q4F23_06000 [Coriobacteriia bacterium]|nr:hypothetical protein [Coriobacteriia bacterium]